MTTNGRGSVTTTTTGPVTSPPVVVPAPTEAAPAAVPARHPDALDLPGLGTAVTALGAAGVASYVLGVLVLQQQLARVGALDAAAAWQAAFLVPRPTVVLHAVHALSTPASLVAAGAFLLTASSWPIVAWSGRWLALASTRQRAGIQAIIFALYLGVLVIGLGSLPLSYNNVPAWADICAGLGGMCGGHLVARGLEHGLALTRRVVWGVVVVYLSSLLVAYFTFAAQGPLLAPVTATYPSGRVQRGLYLA